MPQKCDSKLESAQKHRLTLAQLASYDDVLTDALVDQAYFWSRIRKNRENKYLPVRGIKQDEVPQILLHKVIIAKDVDDAEEALLNLAGLRRYMGGLRIEAAKKDFRNHLRKYINIYLPDCPFEVSTTNRYTITAQEAAVTARKRIREGDKIKYLCGTLVPLTEAELEDLDLSQRNFSIVQSDRKKNTLIFLGPARFANHDCAANGRLVSVGKDGLEVHATRNIDIGEEITVTYSPGYFGSNNEECLCHTCELQARNGWTSAEAFGTPQSGQSTPALGDLPSESPYSFRKKRKHGQDTGPTSSGPSPSPPKKQKLDRPPSRLNQVFTPPPSSQSPDEESTPIIAYGNKKSSDSNGLEEGSQTHRKRSLLDIGIAVSPSAADPPRKKRMRLIDQMTSSAGSSPEMLTKCRPSSTTSDESGNDSSSSKTSSRSTQATSISEASVNIKVETSQTSQTEGDICNGLHSEAILNATHTTLTTTKTSSTIIPSIESPTADSPHPTATTLTTKTTPATTATTTPPLPLPRYPGDYILTRRLLALPHDRWVQCQTCADYFLQSNGYQTRRECPRCERHSMLYGFGWPKTEPDARRLKEIEETGGGRKGKTKTKKTKGVGVRKGKGKGRGRGGDMIVVESSTGVASVRRGRKKKQQQEEEEEEDDDDDDEDAMETESRGGSGGGGSVWGRGGKGGGRSGRSGKGTWVEGGGEDEREERVMDHRTVNRFIAPEEEREVRKRGKNIHLEVVGGFIGSVAGVGVGVGLKDSATPDRMFARLRGSFFGERGASANVSTSASGREESVGSGGGGGGGGAFEDGGEGPLRRSKRYFGSRVTM